MDMNEMFLQARDMVGSIPAEISIVAGAVVVVGMFLFFRSGRKGTAGDLSSEKKIPNHLRTAGVVFDLLTGEPGEESPAARCIITGKAGGRLRCETVEDIDLRGFKPGTRLTASFRPIKVRGRSVNSFVSTFAELEVVDKELVRFLMETPDSYSKVRRRRHSRKRVVDQQFIRAKVWFAGPGDNDVDFMEGVPDLSVNAHDMRSGGRDDNSIINISKGGMGICASADAVASSADVGGDVVINLFMFNYREKAFKPYWYAGTIRSLDDDGGQVRMGIQFTEVAGFDENSGTLIWNML